MIVKLSEIFDCNPSILMFEVTNIKNIEMEVKIKLIKEECYNLEKILKKDEFLKENK